MVQIDAHSSLTQRSLTQRFESVQADDAFLKLFPHRYDYIWAVHPDPGQKPQWQTETRHPLSDRAIQQGAYLYGTRFGKETHYAMLDIDIGSYYHPRQDALAVDKLLSALEPLGLTCALRVQSSHSGGLHLYFPFEKPQVCWKLALAIATLLENSGFKLYPGQLEVFPNPRPYLVEGQPSLYSAHRLPLQMGSYVLDRDYQPINYSQISFLQQWEHALSKNDVEKKLIDRILSQFKRRCFKLSGKADKFLNDLNAEIEPGWTGLGQTNRLLGRIALRAYVFNHILSGDEPLVGDRLVQEIVKIAKALPGYEDWCQHQDEIEARAEEWARSAEQSHYFPYGSKEIKTRSKPIEDIQPTWNQQRLEGTRDKIRNAIADLLNQSNLPSSPTERFKILTTYGLGGGSLYRHKDLWHPEFLSTNPQAATNLLDEGDDNGNLERTFSDSNESEIAISDSNSLSSRPGYPEPQGIEPRFWQAVQQAAEQAADMAQSQQYAVPVTPSLRHLDRMRRYLESNDPILMAEALAWSRRYQLLLSTDCPTELTAPIRTGSDSGFANELEEDLGNNTYFYSLSDGLLPDWVEGDHA